MTLLVIKWSLLQLTCYNSLSMGRKTPKIAPSPWDFITPPEEDRATAIGNMHKKFGKDRVCGSGDMLADRQTDVLITILCHCSHGRSNDKKCTVRSTWKCDLFLRQPAPRVFCVKHTLCLCLMSLLLQTYSRYATIPQKNQAGFFIGQTPFLPPNQQYHSTEEDWNQKKITHCVQYHNRMRSYVTLKVQVSCFT